MKKVILLFLFASVATSLFAQKETYEFTSYAPPKGWQKEVKENTYTSYTTTNKQKNSYCRIIIMLSTVSKGGIKEDFESEWQELIVKNYKPSGAPEVSEGNEVNGWKIKKGTGKFIFDNKAGNVSLTTMSGFNRCISIAAISNSQDYSKDIASFLSSIEMQKPDNPSAPQGQIPQQTSGDNPPFPGIWTATASDQSSFRVKNGVMNYIMRQYTFNANGTYTFISKAFDPLMNDIILGKENGTYQVHDNQISITPEKSVLQRWSKKDGKDEWGGLVNSQNRPLEKITYQFRKHYFSGIREWALILQADKQTQRDGPFTGNNFFTNSWIFSAPSTSHPIIQLPD